MIRINHLQKYFQTKDGQRVKAVEGVDLKIGKGEFIAIVGPSGCGKTTLLKMMSGLLRPDGGKILIEGQALQQHCHSIGYMSQVNALLPWRTVRENIQLGLEIRGMAVAKRRAIADELIQRLDLQGFEDRYPFELSGGMRQRVAIMRALAYNPDILFMDEPFGALDVQTRDLLEDDILRIWSQTHKTIVFITHDLGEAIILADRVVLMTARPGRIKREYRIELPRPRDTAFRLRPEFQQTLRSIWSELSEEVQKARGLVTK